MKYYLHFLQITKLKCENVLLSNDSRTVFNAELSTKVIKEAINILALYLL